MVAQTSHPIVIVALGLRDLRIAHPSAPTDDGQEHPDLVAERSRLLAEWRQTHSGTPPQFLRQLGRHVLDNYDQYKDYIKLPILEPVLEYIRQYYAATAVATLYLVATDQPEATGIHHHNDTILVAQVVAKWLREHADYRIGTVRGAACKAGIAVGQEDEAGAYEEDDKEHFVITNEPADYGVQYRHWDEAFQRLSNRYKALGQQAHLFVGVAGSVPSINTSVLLRAAKHFPGNSSIIYKPMDKPTASEVSIGPDIWREQASQDLRQALAEYRYATARDIVYRYKFAFDLQQIELVGPALNLLVARTNLDFRVARLALDKVRPRLSGRSDALAKELGAQDMQLEVLTQSRLDEGLAKAQLRELYFNALMQDESNHAADFLGRYITLLDLLIAYLVAQITRDPQTGEWKLLKADAVRTWATMRKPQPNWHALNSDLENLAGRRNSEPVHGICFDHILSRSVSPLKPTDDQKTVRLYCGIGLNLPQKHNWEGRLDEANRQNISLNDLRNRNVHQLDPVSKSIIHGYYKRPMFNNVPGESALMSDLRQALSLVDITIDPADRGPYVRLAKVIGEVAGTP